MRRIIGFLRVTTAVFVLALTVGSGTAFAGKKDDTLTIAFQRGILDLDYTQTTKREYIILSHLTDDRLFEVDPGTLKIVPAVASSYKFADDLTLDVTLRKDVKFHDGSKLTADDVVYTYKYALDADAHNKLSKKLGSWLASVEKTGPYSVRFKLKVPYPLALRDMAARIPLRKNGIYEEGGKYVKTAQSAKLTGTGPYKVVSFEPGKKVVLERFDGYYKESPKGVPAIKTIVIRSIPDWGTQQAELMSGGIDWMYSVPTDMAENMAKTGRAIDLKGPSLRVGFIVLDAAGVTAKDGPLTKKAVRQALNHAIDRQAIVDNLVKGDSKVIYSACHPAQFGCAQDVRRYDFDPKKARKMIADAGYPNGFKLALWAYREKEVAEAIAADLTKVGVKVDLRYVKLGALNKARKKGQIPAYFGSWGSGGLADTAAIANVHWRKGSDRNLSGDPELTKLMIGAEKTRDPEKRAELYEKGLKRIAEEAYWVPLYTFTLNYLVSKDLNFPVPRDGLPRLYKASWK